MISAQPSHGILQGNAYSPVAVAVTGNIPYDKIAVNDTGDFAVIVFTSNGGDVSLQASLQRPTTAAPKTSSVSQLSFSGEVFPLPHSMRSDYLLRKQFI